MADFSEWSTRPYSIKVGLRTREGRNLGKAELEVIPPMTRTLSHENTTEGGYSSESDYSSDEEALMKIDTRKVGY
jgi:hypothetical protein